jgi:hypothetical protein
MASKYLSIQMSVVILSVCLSLTFASGSEIKSKSDSVAGSKDMVSTSALPVFLDSSAGSDLVSSQKNKIDNEVALSKFFKKCAELKSGARSKIYVSQLGDSHLQADLESEVTRSVLMDEFGNGGRGLILPYNISKTNEPWTAKTSVLEGLWKARRLFNVQEPWGLKWGGLNVFCQDSLCEIKVGVRNIGKSRYQFSSLKILGDFEVPPIVQMSDSAVMEQKVTWVNPERKMITFSGAWSENSKPGLVWSVIGHNSTEYKHYAFHQSMWADTSVPNQDLVILSLGTNDAIAKNFNEERLRKSIQDVFALAKKRFPDASILVTSPSEFYWNYRPSRYLGRVVSILQDFAFWNLYELSGGAGSVSEWKFRGYLQKDGVHLTHLGYSYRGKILAQALLQSWNRYVLQP